MIRKLGELEELDKLSAEDAKDAVEEEMSRQLRRGLSPDGKAWKKTKSGKAPLRNADKALRIRLVGKSIVMRLEGRYARHHLGAVRGKVRRAIIPTGRITAPISRALKKAISKVFAETVGS